MAEAKESRELAPEESSRVDSLNGRPFTRCVERMAFLVISAGHALPQYVPKTWRGDLKRPCSPGSIML